jgi:hypothetical protein
VPPALREEAALRVPPTLWKGLHTAELRGEGHRTGDELGVSGSVGGGRRGVSGERDVLGRGAGVMRFVGMQKGDVALALGKAVWEECQCQERRHSEGIGRIARVEW